MEEVHPDVYQELQALQDTRHNLTADMTAAPERLKPTYELAMQTIETALEERLQAESVQHLIRAQEGQLQKDIELVNSLVGQGLLRHEQAEAELERIVQHDDYRLLRLARNLGSATLTRLKTATPETPAPSAPTASPPAAQFMQPQQATPARKRSAEPRRSKAPAQPKRAPQAAFISPQPFDTYPERIGNGNIAKAIITESAIIINGSALPNTLAFGSNERNAAFLHTVARMHPGEEISATELWEQSIPGVPVNKQHMRVFREWSAKNLVTPKGQPLLAHNRLKGPSSRYIYQPDTLLDLTDETMPVITAETPAADKLITPLPVSPDEYYRTPNAHEQELIRRVINNIARQAEGDNAQVVPPISGSAEVDFRSMNATQLGQILSSSLHKMQKLARSTQTREQYLRYASRQNDDAAIAFIRLATPVLQRYIRFVGDRELLGIAQQVLRKN